MALDYATGRLYFPSEPYTVDDVSASQIAASVAMLALGYDVDQKMADVERQKVQNGYKSCHGVRSRMSGS